MKILVIRLSSIGDVLLTTPVLRCVKRQLQDAEVHFLTKTANVPLLEHNPYIDRIHTYSPNDDSMLKKLRQERFDFVADLHNNRHSRRVRQALHVKYATYGKENFHKFIFFLTKRNVMSGRHVAERYFDAVETMGVRLDDGGLECYLSPEVEGNAFQTARVGDWNVADLTQDPYVAVACGAQHETKRIPLDKLQELCRAVQYRVLLLGDKNDRKRIVGSGLQFPSHVYNICGETTLMQTAALVKDAAVVVTSDTGIMHMAAAFHRPLLALWGATDPHFGFSAFRIPHIDYVVNPMWCHPCSRMGGRRCPLGHFRCMMDQPWSQIAQKINSIISNPQSFNLV